MADGPWTPLPAGSGDIPSDARGLRYRAGRRRERRRATNGTSFRVLKRPRLRGLLERGARLEHRQLDADDRGAVRRVPDDAFHDVARLRRVHELHPRHDRRSVRRVVRRPPLPQADPRRHADADDDLGVHAVGRLDERRGHAGDHRRDRVRLRLRGRREHHHVAGVRHPARRRGRARRRGPAQLDAVHGCPRRRSGDRRDHAPDRWVRRPRSSSTRRRSCSCSARCSWCTRVRRSSPRTSTHVLVHFREGWRSVRARAGAAAPDRDDRRGVAARHLHHPARAGVGEGGVPRRARRLRVPRAAFGGGAITGSVAIAVIADRYRRSFTATIGGFGLAIGVVGLGVAPKYWFGVAAMYVHGADVPAPRDVVEHRGAGAGRGRVPRPGHGDLPVVAAARRAPRCADRGQARVVDRPPHRDRGCGIAALAVHGLRVGAVRPARAARRGPRSRCPRIRCSRASR